MWKGKIWPGAWRISLFLAAAVCVTACGGPEEKKAEVLLYEGEGAASGSAVSGAAVSASDSDFEVTTVRKTTCKEEFSDVADIEYTDKETLYIFEENAVLDAVKVKKSQAVKKGDVLAEYHVKTSKTKLAKQKLENDQARAEFESGLSSLNRELEQARSELGQLRSQAEKNMKRLEIKKMEKQIAAYKKGEKELLSQEKEYASLVQMQKGVKLVAKKNGIITKTASSKVGEEIDSSDKIIEMRSNNKWVLKVEDPESKLRYNMDVVVRLGTDVRNFKDELRGKVITASDITGVEETDEEGNSVVYIEISEADKKKYDFENQNIYVYAVSFSIDDALVVDAKAVYSESVKNTNKLYVMVVENGKLHKRFIVSNYKTEREYLIDQGVTEGQALAILD